MLLMANLHRCPVSVCRVSDTDVKAGSYEAVLASCLGFASHFARIADRGKGGAGGKIMLPKMLPLCKPVGIDRCQVSCVCPSRLQVPGGLPEALGHACRFIRPAPTERSPWAPAPAIILPNRLRKSTDMAQGARWDETVKCHECPTLGCFGQGVRFRCGLCVPAPDRLPWLGWGRLGVACLTTTNKKEDIM